MKITVIGDVMLDKTISGEVNRISPEAPVPIVNINEEIYKPGGAANTAANISSLGGKVYLFGFIGKDENAKILLDILNEKKIECFFDEKSITTLKVRIKSKNQQLLRYDYEDTNLKNFNLQILEIMKKKIEDSDIILISDYAKGTITKDLMTLLNSLNKKILIDPKPKNMNTYLNPYLITPNEKEVLEMSKQTDVLSAGRFLREKFNCNVLMTRGEKGMYLFSDREIEIPTDTREVCDVEGAGDTAIAAIALSLASRASLEESAIIANHAAGIAVSRIGTSQIKLNELKKRISGEEGKLKTFEELRDIIMDLKDKGKKITWTNGRFDILHVGNVKFLKKARENGDYLIIGLNSDSSFKALKGREPINNELQRAEILSEYADAVIIFPEFNAIRHLSVFKPDIYVKGGNYTLETINQEEREVIESYGGKILIIDVDTDISTTKIMERTKNLEIAKEVKNVEKLWGKEVWMANEEKYCGKRLYLTKGKRCSLHFHKNKDETFYIESGKVLMEIEGEVRILNPGDFVKIIPGVKHRFSGLEDSLIIEISTFHEDSDSYRVEGQLSGDIPEEIKKKYELIKS